MQAVILEEKPGTSTEVVNGRTCWIDGKGNYIREELVKPQDKLVDETVRKIIRFALELSAQIERFKAHTMADLEALDGLLEQEYGFVKTGRKGKGNRTYMTFNGLMKVTVQVADFIDFGPELQVAKGLIDECLNEWSAESGPEIQTIVTRAFNTDKEGRINRSEIFMLLRLEIADARWRRAMAAIRDAMRITGRKEYVRFAMRERPDAEWRAVTIDLAKA
ncbi:DUF3164 family protein [Chelativorans alearense]|uniref:DUF3164 family protein n=1 Tax=Chelativorans alearense TaxID=2681495 RepID=UPI0013D2A8D2|nr:DUF3164 family protein [Chelativorans alearense]